MSNSRGAGDEFEMSMESRESALDLEMLRKELRVIRKEYRKLQQRYLDLYEYIPDLSISIDEELDIVDCNEPCAYLMGYKQEELIGKSISHYLTDKSRFLVKEISSGHKNDGNQLRKLKLQFTRKDGKIIEVSADIDIASQQGKKIYQYRLIFGDISETKRLKQELQNKQYLLDTILKTMNEGVAIISPQYKIQFMNECMTKILGARIGEHCYKVFHSRKARCPDDLCPVVQIIGGNSSYHCVYRKNKEGNLFEITAFPFQNIDHTQSILEVVKDVTEILKLKEELKECKQTYLKELRERYQLDNIIGKSKKMQEVYDLVISVAQTQCTVLIQGESGTGKELIARAIHYNSPHSGGPFLAVCCSVFSENILESELFGHVKGAFTGAIRNKPGRFELANGGTIFLDEIGDISLSIQAKLLRVLQEREFERVGGEDKVKVNLRVVAATNKDLEKEVREGRFREDLYYRLTVIPIFLPPLREKIEDIPLLVDHLLDKYRQTLKKNIQGVSPEAMGILLNYPWPGNVRELESALEYAFVRCSGLILTPSDFPSKILKAKETSNGKDAFNGKEASNRKDESKGKEVSKGKEAFNRKEAPDGERVNERFRARNSKVELPKELIAAALQEAAGNRSDAARILNVSRTTFWRLMKRHGLLQGF
jgi:PAS domain S-box-containing protein